jgi:dTDP-D-glucose 4,6-dehydratase
MHVDDVTSAFLRIIERGEVGKIYNIGTKEEYRVLQVAELILKKCPESKSKVELVTDRNFNDQRYKIDTTKLENLGWKCKHELTNDIHNIVDWYKNNPMYWENIEHLMKPHPKK